MPRGKKYTAGQIIGKHREAEVGLAQGKTVPGGSGVDRPATSFDSATCCESNTGSPIRVAGRGVGFGESIPLDNIARRRSSREKE